MNKDSPNIHTHMFNLLKSMLEESGIPPALMVLGTGLKASDLAQTDTLVTFPQALKIVDNALELAPTSGLGLAIAKRMNFTDWGTFGYAVTSCATLGDALKIGVRYSSIATRLTENSFSITDAELSLSSNTLQSVGNSLPFFIEEDLGGVINVMYKNLGVDVRPKEVHLSYSAPKYAEQYSEHFRCPVTFNSFANQIIWDRSLLEFPLPTHNPVTAEHAIQLCEKQLFDLTEEGNIERKVRSLLIQASGKFAAIGSIASQLEMSESTLRRVLKVENTSYQKILEQMKKKKSIEYLTTSSLPIDDISFLVGFSDTSNFRRAFKKWTGESPIAYRKKFRMK